MVVINLRGLLWFVVVGIASAAVGQADPQRDFVVAGKDVFMMLPPEFVCGPNVRSVSWSPDGDRLAVEREFTDVSPAMVSDLFTGKEVDRSTIEPETQIIVWSAVTRKSTTVFRLKQSQGLVTSMDWIAGSSSLLVDVNYAETGEAAGSRNSIMILSNTGSTLSVAQIDQSHRYVLNPSPMKPLVLLQEYAPDSPAAPKGEPEPPREPSSIRFFGTNGVLSGSIKMPGPTCIPFWSNNGGIYVLSIVRKPNVKVAERVWYIVDRSAETVKPSAAPPDAGSMFERSPTGVLKTDDLSPQLAGIKVGVQAPTVTISSADAKDDELAIVTTDGKRSDLSPKLNGVSYQSQGSLMVRSMVKVSLEAYLKAKEAAVRAKLLSNAKQVGLALLMNANDNDDNFLSKDSNLQNALGPYLKNNDLLNGFNYTFSGGNAANVEQPASTILGYFDGPGGRAIVYCDGHAKWINNP